MSALPGNQNALGNSGGKEGRSGRKSAYQEKADADFLYHIFFDEINKAEIQAKIASGSYAVKDILILKALEGNERVVSELFRKLFPDKALIEQRMKVQSSFSLVDLFRRVKEKRKENDNKNNLK